MGVNICPFVPNSCIYVEALKLLLKEDGSSFKDAYLSKSSFLAIVIVLGYFSNYKLFINKPNATFMFIEKLFYNVFIVFRNKLFKIIWMIKISGDWVLFYCDGYFKIFACLILIYFLFQLIL